MAKSPAAPPLPAGRADTRVRSVDNNPLPGSLEGFVDERIWRVPAPRGEERRVRLAAEGIGPALTPLRARALPHALDPARMII